MSGESEGISSLSQRNGGEVATNGVTKEHEPTVARLLLLDRERLEVVERRVEQGLDASPVGTWLEPKIDGGVLSQRNQPKMSLTRFEERLFALRAVARHLFVAERLAQLLESSASALSRASSGSRRAR